MKRLLLGISLSFALIYQTGCIGIGAPHPFQARPWTLLSEGDQLGRDQMANRWLVATARVPLKGLDGNSVLTILGQPQQVEVQQRDISEDWYFIYHKNYKVPLQTKEGLFMLRLHENRVVDTVRVN